MVFSSCGLHPSWLGFSVPVHVKGFSSSVTGEYERRRQGKDSFDCVILKMSSHEAEENEEWRMKERHLSCCYQNGFASCPEK